jgi:hypothetical protein
VAVLTVTNSPVALTEQPMSQTNGVGSTVTLFVHGFGTEVFFQWLKGGTNLMDGTNTSGSIISGSTNFELTIRNAQTNDSGSYSIIVSNSVNSVTSSNAILVIVAAPTILVPPTNHTVGLGAAVNFSVTAVGEKPLSYLWQKDGTNLATGGHVSGATTNSILTITNTQTGDAGGYSVIVTNLAGAVTSSPPAVLTVLTVPQFVSIIAEGGTNFAVSGVGGTNRGTYFVLTSSNLLVPLGSWTRTATNQFGSQGQFSFTNIAPTNTPQLFYILQMPSP